MEPQLKSWGPQLVLPCPSPGPPSPGPGPRELSPGSCSLGGESPTHDEAPSHTVHPRPALRGLSALFAVSKTSVCPAIPQTTKPAASLHTGDITQVKSH